MQKKTLKRLVVVGDVHGQFNGFVKILQHAKLIDANLNWRSTDDRLLQIGDVFDRGPHSLQVDALLDKLQKQAANSKGEVIRLIGNHELELLLGNYAISGLKPPQADPIKKKLSEQVIEGSLKAAYAYKGFLLTHAGVTQRLYRIFQMQLEEMTAVNISILINLIFKESVQHQFFKHPIFNISISRKGVNKFGGIFWEDLTDLVKSYTRSPIWQVVGHTPVERIIIDPNAQIIPVDVGMHRKLQYLVIDSEGNLSIETVPFSIDNPSKKSI